MQKKAIKPNNEKKQNKQKSQQIRKGKAKQKQKKTKIRDMEFQRFLKISAFC